MLWHLLSYLSSLYFCIINQKSARQNGEGESKNSAIKITFLISQSVFLIQRYLVTICIGKLKRFFFHWSEPGFNPIRQILVLWVRCIDPIQICRLDPLQSYPDFVNARNRVRLGMNNNSKWRTVRPKEIAFFRYDWNPRSNVLAKLWEIPVWQPSVADGKQFSLEYHLNLTVIYRWRMLPSTRIPMVNSQKYYTRTLQQRRINGDEGKPWFIFVK